MSDRRELRVLEVGPVDEEGLTARLKVARLGFAVKHVGQPEAVSRAHARARGLRSAQTGSQRAWAREVVDAGAST
jgi:hypothetical protein